MTDLSIIIISYNTAQITKKCLETVISSLKDAPFTTEIIVLDNASSDNSLGMLEETRRRGGRAGARRRAEARRDREDKRKREGEEERGRITMKIIESKENLGFSKGNNVAMKQSTGKYLLFLNSDTEVIDDAVSSLYAFFTGSTNTFNFVGPKLIERDGSTSQASAGHFYSLPVIFAAFFLRGDYYGLTRFSPTIPKQVDWVSGACFICKREDFEKLGGFDDGIFMYMEEIDLLYRAKKKEMTTGFYPESKFIHLGSASSAGRSEPIIQVYKGFLYFYKKHHSPLQLHVLRIMLQLKAVIALIIGALINSAYLKKTYAQALKIATHD